MLKKLFSLVMAIALVLSLAACAGTASNDTSSSESSGNGTVTGTSTGDVITLKLSDCHSPTAVNHLAMLKIAEEVKTQTNGAIEIEVYPSSQLGDVKASMEAIQMNTLDMAICNQAVLGTVVPEFGVIGAPFMFESDDHIKNALNGELGEKLGELAQQKNLTIACYLPTGFRHVFSTVPVETPEDFKGLKIRTMENPVDIGIFNALGAISTPMGYSELFTALQQGTVNAGENAVSNILGDKFYEVANYVTLTGHTYNVCPVLISDSAIEKIPEDLRETFFNACTDGAEKGRQMCMEANDTAKTDLEADDVEFFDIDRAVLKEDTQPLYDEFSDRIPADMITLVEAAAK